MALCIFVSELLILTITIKGINGKDYETTERRISQRFSFNQQSSALMPGCLHLYTCLVSLICIHATFPSYNIYQSLKSFYLRTCNDIENQISYPIYSSISIFHATISPIIHTLKFTPMYRQRLLQSHNTDIRFQ